jgi:cobalt-zinc-cadmium efflux system membrane fusion protein
MAMNSDPPRPLRFHRRRLPAGLHGLLLLSLALAGMANACSSGEAKPDERGARPETSSETAPEATEAETTDSVVRLDSAAQRLAGIEVRAVDTAGTNALVANGTITYDANRVAVVGPRVEGRLAAVRADLGERVGAGAVLAVVESPEVGELRGELARAEATLEVARRNYEREQRLFRQEITSQKELLEAEGAYRSAEADIASARARLEAVGAGSGKGAAFGLRTPLSGTVVERNASPGQLVDPSSNLFTVADIRDVWITVDVYESDLSRVQQGAPATVLPRALPGEEFEGRVTYAGGVVDSATRTFKVRVQVENPERRLRPGMFAQVRIAATAASGQERPAAVPQTAVQDLEGKPVVFVPGRRAGEFIARMVTVGPPAGDTMVTITDGLRLGDRIVTRGAFQLKSELTKASFAEEE